MAKSPESKRQDKRQVSYREPDSAFVFRNYGYLRAIDMLYEEFDDDCGIPVVYLYGNVGMAKAKKEGELRKLKKEVNIHGRKENRCPPGQC